jgi:hypothetical protein
MKCLQNINECIIYYLFYLWPSVTSHRACRTNRNLGFVLYLALTLSESKLSQMEDSTDSRTMKARRDGLYIFRDLENLKFSLTRTQPTKPKGLLDRMTSGVAVKSNRSRLGVRNVKRISRSDATFCLPQGKIRTTKPLGLLGTLPYVSPLSLTRKTSFLSGCMYSWPMR